MAVVYSKSEDDGDGTDDGQIGHACLQLDDDASWLLWTWDTNEQPDLRNAP